MTRAYGNSPLPRSGCERITIQISRATSADAGPARGRLKSSVRWRQRAAQHMPPDMVETLGVPPVVTRPEEFWERIIESDA